MTYGGKEPLLSDRKQSSICRPKLVSFLGILALFGVVYGFFWGHSTRNYALELENEVNSYRRLIRNLTVRMSKERDYYNSQFRRLNETISEGKQCCGKQQDAERKVAECNGQLSEESLKCKEQINLSTENLKKLEHESSMKLQVCSAKLARLEESSKSEGHKLQVNTSSWEENQKVLRSTTGKPELVPLFQDQGRAFRGVNTNKGQPIVQINDPKSGKPSSNESNLSEKKSHGSPFRRTFSGGENQSVEQVIPPRRGTIPPGALSDITSGKGKEVNDAISTTTAITAANLQQAKGTSNITGNGVRGVIQGKDIITQKTILNETKGIQKPGEYDEEYSEEYESLGQLENATNIQQAAPVGKMSTSKEKTLAGKTNEVDDNNDNVDDQEEYE